MLSTHCPSTVRRLAAIRKTTGENAVFVPSRLRTGPDVVLGKISRPRLVRRNEELFERAAQLRDRQRKLEEELKELQNEFGELSEEGRDSLLEALGLPPQPSQDVRQPAHSHALYCLSEGLLCPCCERILKTISNILQAFKNDLEGLPPIIKRSLEQAGAWDPFLASQAARASSGKVSLDVDQAQCQADAEFMDGDEEEFEVLSCTHKSAEQSMHCLPGGLRLEFDHGHDGFEQRPWELPMGMLRSPYPLVFSTS